jgi:hypothetical protein
MLQQRIGDLLEIKEGKRHFYVVVLTNVVYFGGNIVFAFHSDGGKRDASELAATDGGFNICCDLLWPKRDGAVTRLSRFADVSPFWRTRFVKATNEIRQGVRAKEWFVFEVDKLGGQHFLRANELADPYRAAMDGGCYSFDLVAERILARYTPDQNEHL